MKKTTMYVMFIFMLTITVITTLQHLWPGNINRCNGFISGICLGFFNCILAKRVKFEEKE